MYMLLTSEKRPPSKATKNIHYFTTAKLKYLGASKFAILEWAGQKSCTRNPETSRSNPKSKRQTSNPGGAGNVNSKLGGCSPPMRYPKLLPHRSAP